MGQLQDLMYKESSVVIRDVTAAQFAAQSVGAPSHPGIRYRVDGSAEYRWNGSEWIATVESAVDLLTGMVKISTPDQKEGDLKILATRTGQNGGRGVTSAGFHTSSLMKHHLPYGAKSLRYAYTGITVDTSGEFPSPPTALLAVAVAIAAGGTGHAAGDIVTLVAGGTGQIAASVRVVAVNAGAITQAAVHEPGCWDAAPTNPVAQASTSGAGAGATFTISFGVSSNLINVALQPDSEVQSVTQRVYFGVTPTGFARSYANVTPGGVMISSSVPVDLPVGRRIATRMFTQGGALPAGRRIRGGERFGFSATTTDDSASASVTTITEGSYGNGHQPLCIFGTPQVAGSTLVIFGDSIDHSVVGTASAPDTMDASGNACWLERTIADRMPFMNLACPGIAASELFSDASKYVMTIGQLRALRREGVVFDTAFDGLFINDANGATTYNQIVAWKRTLWRELRALGFKRIVVRTAFPMCSGTFADLAGQTVLTSNQVDQKIQQWNADLVAGTYANEIDAYVDLRPFTESPSATGKWVPGMTDDGTHPNIAACVAMAAGTDYKVFL